ncbi:unnamed protein product [Orchesella dallaii]|uniref:ShKT domain-containing protein n=1 Tax=Orchesella dallaii TaxID=48710 RepID=A0ABP1PRY7_9HEXA
MLPTLLWAIILLATLSTFGTSNTITTERSLQDNTIFKNVGCKNELPSSFCEKIVDDDNCDHQNEDSPFRNGCLQSCGLCDENDKSQLNHNRQMYDTDEQRMDDWTNDLPDGESKGGCEDKIPNCSSYLSVCCSMKDAMNVSCQKTCRFCSESPATPPPGAPGLGIGETTMLPVTGSTNQDPCDPTKPPSGNVDVPGQTTTTTQSAIPGNPLPGNPITTNAPPLTIDMPGQTTTTTTQSPIPGNPYPGNPIG